jgi:non-heme chloroperoxidase
MFFLAERGYRCIAHDRRGHGRSSQPWQGNDMNAYAGDLAQLVQSLDLSNAIHVGQSTGGGEVARYIGRHGTKRVAKALLIGAIPPLMLKTTGNPEGTPTEALDARSSSRTWRCRSTARAGPGPRSRRGCATRSGCRG